MPRLGVFLLVSIALSLSGCGTSASPGITAKSDHPTEIHWFVADSSGVSTVDPTRATDPGSLDAITLVSEGLVRLGRDMNIQPAAALSWKESGHGRRYVFTLRRALRFSNGRRVTPDDVVASFQRALAPAVSNGEMAGYLPELARSDGRPAITAIGKNRIQFMLAYPSAPFLAKLSFTGLDIVDVQNIHRYGALWSLHSDGLGPYRLKGSATRSSVRFVPNPYYLPRPPTHTVTMRFGSPSSGVQQFRLGRVNLVTGLKPTVVLPSPLKHDLHVAPTNTLDYVILNTRISALANLELRQALALSCNRPQIVAAVFGRGALPTGAYVPISLLPHAYQQRSDSRMAAQLLTVARKQQDGKIGALRLIYDDVVPFQKRWADVLAAVWYRALRLQVHEVGLSAPAYIAAIHSGNYDLATVRWGARYPDADDFLLAQLDGRSPDDFAGWNDRTFNRMMSASQQYGVDSKKRIRYLLAAAKLAAISSPWIPIDSPAQAALISPSLSHISLDSNGLTGFRQAG